MRALALAGPIQPKGGLPGVADSKTMGRMTRGVGATLGETICRGATRGETRVGRPSAGAVPIYRHTYDT